MTSPFRDAALLLLAHGSTGNVEEVSARETPVARLRRSGLFAEVHDCYWKRAPRLEDVLPSVGSHRLFVVPLFVSEGYFSEEVIPTALNLKAKGASAFDRVQPWQGRLLFYCYPVGGHPVMTEIVLRLAREVVNRDPAVAAPPDRETLLLIAGHGTGQHARSRRAIERQADLVRSQESYADVRAVFLEEAPRIADWCQASGPESVVVVPFFMGEGIHTREDIPVLLGEPRAKVRERLRAGAAAWRNPTRIHGRRVWYSDIVGNDPALDTAILGRVRELAASSRG